MLQGYRNLKGIYLYQGYENYTFLKVFIFSYSKYKLWLSKINCNLLLRTIMQDNIKEKNMLKL